MPDQLPHNVEWIENTAPDMSDVANCSCDLVFSGQNIEHLWPEEVAGFMAEAARVTKLGGHLVIDSPNRLLTSFFNWSHREHTVELTVNETIQLMEMAGFDVTKCAGIWLCRDPRSHRMLPLDPNCLDSEWTLIERVLAARDNPQDSFLWWIEGKRNSKAPDVLGLHNQMQQIFAEAWPERTQRSLVARGTSITRDCEDWITVAEDDSGAITYGPFMPLKAGRHRITFMVDIPAGNVSPVGTVEAVNGVMDQVATAEIAAGLSGQGKTSVTIEFYLRELEFGMQFRCLSYGKSTFSVRRHVDIKSL